MIQEQMTAMDARTAMIRRLARQFRAGGEEIFLVGGAVRDAILGRADYDLDFATSAAPERTVAIIESLGLGHPYRVGEKYGTIGVATDFGPIEITTYRTGEVYPEGSRKPIVEFGRSLRDDLERRDFTINAMAEDPLDGTIVDPFGGRQDLELGILRAVGEPAARFSEDPLRLLRGARFAARLGLAIEGRTWDAMQREAGRLNTISRERIRDEYSRILTNPDPVRGLTLLRDSRLLATSIPQLLELTGMPDHGPRHPLSLWDHTMRVVEGVSSELEVRWAALLHDIAKPATRTHEPSGRPRFFHHEERGAEMARAILSGLRYPHTVVASVALLVETHMQVHGYSPEWSDGAVRRLELRLGPLLPLAIDLARADAAGHSLAGKSENSPRYDALAAHLARLQAQAVKRLESPLSGDDLMQRYDRPPGPWIRRIKDALREEVIDGNLDPHDRERAWEIADALVESAQ